MIPGIQGKAYDTSEPQIAAGPNTPTASKYVCCSYCCCVNFLTADSPTVESTLKLVDGEGYRVTHL